jgi:hypothetical protein
MIYRFFYDVYCLPPLTLLVVQLVASLIFLWIVIALLAIIGVLLVIGVGSNIAIGHVPLQAPDSAYAGGLLFFGKWLVKGP